MKRTLKLSTGVLLVVLAVLLVVALGTASAARQQVRVPAVGFRLHADLTPVGTATGSGRFDALLVRTGPGLVRMGQLPGATAPPGVTCPPDPKMGVPCVIGGTGGQPTLPVPPVPATGTHSMLVWRLALTGVTAPASATINLGAQGAASSVMSTLCTACGTVVRGHMQLTSEQAQQLLKGNGTVDVHASSGELAGTIHVVSHVVFQAPSRRTGH